MNTLVHRIAKGIRWERNGEYVINVNNGAYVYVECTNLADKQFDAIFVKDEMQECELLQRVSRAYDNMSLLPTYSEEAIAAFETKHCVKLPALLAFQLTRISSQFLSHTGSSEWIVKLDDCLVYTMQDVTASELQKGDVEKVVIAREGTATGTTCTTGTPCTTCMRIHTHVIRDVGDIYFDLILNNLGKGMMMQHGGIGTQGSLYPLRCEVLQTFNALHDIIDGDFDDWMIWN